MGLWWRTIALVSTALALAPGCAWADAVSHACQDTACRHRLLVGPSVKTLRTDEVFDQSQVYLSVRLLSDGRPLRQVAASGLEGCRRTMRGYGVEATVSTCADPGPVRVTAARLHGAPGWITLSCRAWPYLNAGAGSSSSTSGGAMAPRFRFGG